MNNLPLSPRDIVEHLRLYLPRFSDRFSIPLDVASAVVEGADTVRVTTTTPHDLTTGNILTVTKVNGLKNLIAQASEYDSTRTQFQTFDEHDLTLPQKPLDPTTVFFEDFTDPLWNGEHKIAGVLNRKTLVLENPQGAGVPTLNLSNVLIEKRQVNVRGCWPITKIDDTSFSFQTLGLPALPGFEQNFNIPGFEATTQIKVVAAADFKRAADSYTGAQVAGGAWLYVIMGEHLISKDRNNYNDGIATLKKAQDEGRLLTLQNFSTVVFLNTTDSLTGGLIQDAMYSEIYPALLKTLYGFSPRNGKSHFATIPAGHGQSIPVSRDYNTAFYGHVFDWQTPQYIDFTFGFQERKDVAFRDLKYNFNLFDIENPDKLELSINLDEEPNI